ncbi:zinc finger protein ZFP2-like [Battus philenor]|uniref:zinc finger protein ZFP2-like n=1 Tax=Battus philenor TaxID=42288 RepID=UPI0035CFEE39
MLTLKNTSLNHLYETLVGGYPNTKHNMSDVVCYMCYARLKSCRRLQMQALKSKDILQEMIGEVMNVLTQFNTQVPGDSLHITPVYHVNLEPMQELDLEITCKIEPEPFPSTVKLENRIGIQKEDNIAVAEFDKIEDFPEDSTQDRLTDSEDDLPLISIGSNSKKKPASTVKKRKSRDDKEFKVEANEIELTEEEQKMELLVRANSENYLNSPYKCEKCYKGFVHPQAFSNHMEKHDQRSGAHECGVCRLRYGGARQLRAHVASAHARRYACTKCPHRSHTRHQARDHEKWHNGHTYPCQICGQKFQKPTSYLTHVRKHHSEHVCERCGDSFVGRHGLLMHLSKSHKRDDPQQDDSTEAALERYCSECNIQFLTINAWKKHILTSFRHTGKNETSSRCDLCGEEVSSLSRGAHMRGHMRELREPSTITTHLPATPALRCGQCEAQFVTRSRLQAHVKRVHLGVKYNKNVVCEMCGKRCTSAAALRCHQRRHTGERPFACSQCPARFAERGRLRVHSRTHSGERPYACHACHKRFSQKPALNRHYRVHSGARPYACGQCTKCFSQSNSLKLHIRTVHQKLPSVRKQEKTTPVANTIAAQD